MDRIQRLLKIWTKIATHIRLRDRSVKVIQYGCQMLLGYYGAQMTTELKTSLSMTRVSASNSRKLFWMLKSLNHLGDITNMIQEGFLTRKTTVLEKLSLIEQFYLVLYYWYENYIFLMRMKLVSVEPIYIIDYRCNWTWFWGDLAAFASSIIRLHDNKKMVSDARGNSFCSDGRHAIGSNHGTEKVASSHNFTNLTISEIDSLLKERFMLRLSVAINFFEVAASAHYVGIYKSILGRDINDGHVGLFGVCSSTLILYEGYLKIRDDV